MLYTTFKELLHFEKGINSTDEYGGTITKWQPIFKAWGRINFEKSVSKKHQDLEMQKKQYLIITRNHSQINLQINKNLRIICAHKIYYIENVSIIDDMAKYIELTTNLGENYENNS